MICIYSHSSPAVSRCGSTVAPESRESCDHGGCGHTSGVVSVPSSVVPSSKLKFDWGGEFRLARVQCSCIRSNKFKSQLLTTSSSSSVTRLTPIKCSAGVRGHHTDITESKKKKIGIVILLKSRRPELASFCDKRRISSNRTKFTFTQFCISRKSGAHVWCA
ncbi:hypothetical protein EMCRGX_G015076 [Ephydatia muelleri]